MPCRCYATEFSPCGSRSFTAFLCFIHYFDLLLCSLRVGTRYRESQAHNQFDSICGIIGRYTIHVFCMYVLWMNKKLWPVVLCSTISSVRVWYFFFVFIRLTRPTENWKLRDICITPWLFVLYMDVRIHGTHTHSFTTNKHNNALNDRNINYCVCVSIILLLCHLYESKPYVCSTMILFKFKFHVLGHLYKLLTLYWTQQLNLHFAWKSVPEHFAIYHFQPSVLEDVLIPMA